MHQWPSYVHAGPFAPAMMMHRDISHAQRMHALTALQIVKTLNLSIDDGELKDMIHEFDTDKDGAISLDEFLAIMNASSD